jgi:hypothetical protein
VHGPHGDRRPRRTARLGKALRGGGERLLRDLRAGRVHRPGQDDGRRDARPAGRRRELQHAVDLLVVEQPARLLGADRPPAELLATACGELLRGLPKLRGRRALRGDRDRERQVIWLYGGLHAERDQAEHRRGDRAGDRGERDDRGWTRCVRGTHGATPIASSKLNTR